MVLIVVGINLWRGIGIAQLRSQSRIIAQLIITKIKVDRVKAESIDTTMTTLMDENIMIVRYVYPSPCRGCY